VARHLHRLWVSPSNDNDASCHHCPRFYAYLCALFSCSNRQWAPDHLHGSRRDGPSPSIYLIPLYGSERGVVDKMVNLSRFPLHFDVNDSLSLNLKCSSFSLFRDHVCKLYSIDNDKNAAIGVLSDASYR
jgi:hypothetical protein